MPAPKGTGGRPRAVNSVAGNKETSKNIRTGVQKKITSMFKFTARYAFSIKIA